MQPTVDRDVRVGRAVALAGIVASAVLSALNISVGLYVQSSSVFATGVEFAGDVLASAVVLVGLIIAGKPADENHPYGHGRIESLAAFVVGLILVAGGIGVCWNALRAVGDHHPPPRTAAKNRGSGTAPGSASSGEPAVASARDIARSNSYCVRKPATSRRRKAL